MYKGFMAFDGSKNNSKRKGKSISYSSRMKTSCNTVLKYSPHLLGGYKQKIKTLSENNKALVEALENYRYQCSEKDKTLIQVSTAALQNSISAKAKLNKLAKDLKDILISVEEITSIMNTNSSAYPTKFVGNLRLKKPRDCLSGLMESISEEADWDDLSKTKPHSSLGVNGNGNNNSSSLLPTKRIAESKNTNPTKIPSIQKLNEAEVLEAPSESRKRDFSSDAPKSLPSDKRRRNPSEGKAVRKNEHHADNVSGKPQEGMALRKNKKPKVKLDSKAGKTKRQAKKNRDGYPSVHTFSNPVRKRTKALAEPSTPQVEKKIEVASLDEETACFERSNVGERLDREGESLQETVGSRKRSRNEQILCSVENVPRGVAVKTTVTAEVHKPPSDKLAERKPFSPNVKIMQPCVVLTDIRDTPLLTESGEGGFVKVRSKEDGKKRRLTGRKKKSRGSLPSRPESSRLCRSRPVISYKENNLNKKMRRS